MYFMSWTHKHIGLTEAEGTGDIILIISQTEI